MTNTPPNFDSQIWSQADWERLEVQTRTRALQASTDAASWEVVVKQARHVLRTYSTSFFVVTRFLPPQKRSQVEAIYAAVRFPDEIVDTFFLTAPERVAMLDQWAEHYEAGLRNPSWRVMLNGHVPCFLASFVKVVQEAGIPPQHYRAFLEAMRLDVCPPGFRTLDDLIDRYVYGSAIVVGYFLAYVYGENQRGDFARALDSARDLGIALQLTNFLRDVAEDHQRGRHYLPRDLLLGEGITELAAADPQQQAALKRVLRRLSEITDHYYEKALAGVNAFAPDSQVAIRACIDVYRQLNSRIANSPRGILQRESVPARDKFKVLPVSKYWRLPLAYLRS